MTSHLRIMLVSREDASSIASIRQSCTSVCHCVLAMEKGDSEIPVIWFAATNWDFGQAKLGAIRLHDKLGFETRKQIAYIKKNGT